MEAMEPMKYSQASKTEPQDATQTNVPDGGEGEPVNTSRRRFTRAGLSGSVVMTLASRPAFATYCSHSGSMSGNLSRPNAPTCSGLMPTYWMHNKPSWTVCVPGKKNPLSGQNGSAFNYDHITFGDLKDAKDNAVITQSKFDNYKNWAGWQDTTNDAALPNPSNPPTTCGDGFAGSGLTFTDPNRTMMQTICDDTDSLAAHACAALLNCHYFGETTFGYTSSSLMQFLNTWTSGMSGLKDALAFLNGRVS